MFHVLELERLWRIKHGLDPGFSILETRKPVVALGATEPLEGALMEFDFFRSLPKLSSELSLLTSNVDGKDGLGGIHTHAPHFTPTEMWKHLFTPSDSSSTTSESLLAHLPPNFKPSARPSHEEVLDFLRTNEPDTITIIAMGPLANLALAAAADPETFLRAKEVVVMGGAHYIEGNITPVAEFNSYSCAYSAARIYALTSPNPASTMPPCKTLPPYPVPLSKTLNLTVLPLDITTFHLLKLSTFNEIIGNLTERGSPLAQWVKQFLTATFEHISTLRVEQRPRDVDLSLHDPLCVWYVLTQDAGGWKMEQDIDVRVEVGGNWTRGMTVVDRRKKKIEEDLSKPVKIYDRGNWLHKGYGNRVRVAVDSPSRPTTGEEILRRIFKC
jgi:inosine-uridine nucleoside N-ribohydrolase